MPKKFKCDICDAGFVNYRNVLRHKRNIHKFPFSKSKHHAKRATSSTCHYSPDCPYNFRTLDDYREHLESSHDTPNEPVEITFSSSEDFHAWREETETTTSSQFITRSVKNLVNGRKFYYCCNRSGFIEKMAVRIRRMKSQGSRKINSLCPAGFTAMYQGDSVCVKYYGTHLGHDKLLSHSNLPTRLRMEIAGKLAQGLSEKTIIQEIRSSVNTTLHRQHLITLKDVQNIRAFYGIPRGEQTHVIHSDDIVGEEEVKVNIQGECSVTEEISFEASEMVTFNSDDVSEEETSVEDEKVEKKKLKKASYADVCDEVDTDPSFTISELPVAIDDGPFDSEWLVDAFNKICSKPNLLFSASVAEQIMGHIDCIEKLVDMSDSVTVLSDHCYL